eukprot:11131718-Heterocapsa_arctica.AAC.1
MRTKSRGRGWRPRERRCPTRSSGRPSGRVPVPPWAGSAGCRLHGSPGSPRLPCLAQLASWSAGCTFSGCKSLEPRA